MAFNWHAPELWRRFTITLRRVLARRTGLSIMDDVVALDPAARRRPSARSSGRGADVLTVPELAEYLRLSLATTYVYLRDGTIPVGERIGRRWIVPRARLDAWLSGQREGGR